MQRVLARVDHVAALLAVSGLAGLGSQMASVLLPLAAIESAGVSAGQLGILSTLLYAPYLFVSPFAGVLLERVEKRRVLGALGIVSALLALSLALATSSGPLSVVHLAMVAVGIGTVNAIWAVAMSPFIVGVVGRARLVDVNAKLMTLTGVNRVAGPGVTGTLLSALGPAFAFVATAVAFLGSTLCLVKLPQVFPASSSPSRSVRRDLVEGWAVIAQDARLRAITASGAHYNFSAQMMLTVFLLWAANELKLEAGTIGGVLAIGQLGWLVGPLLAPQIGRRLGLGHALTALLLADALVVLAIPLVSVTGVQAAVAISAILFVHGTIFSASTTQSQAIRQALTPANAFSRVTASYFVVTLGVIPLGGLTAGTIGELLGLRNALVVAALTYHATWIWIIRSPLIRLRDLADLTEPA